MFTGSGGTWTEAQQLTADNGKGSDLFGASVSLSSNGNNLVIGAKGKWLGGAVYVFTGSGSTWTQAKKLTAFDHSDPDMF